MRLSDSAVFENIRTVIRVFHSHDVSCGIRHVLAVTGEHVVIPPLVQFGIRLCDVATAEAVRNHVPETDVTGEVASGSEH